MRYRTIGRILLHDRNVGSYMVARIRGRVVTDRTSAVATLQTVAPF